MIAQDDLTEEIERLHQEINKLTANYRHLQQEYDTYKSNNEQELASRRGYTDTEELSKAISTLEEQVNSYKIKYDEATEQALSTKSSLINYMREPVLYMRKSNNMTLSLKILDYSSKNTKGFYNYV